MEFTHKESKHVIIYGKKCDDGRLWCIDKKTKAFLKIAKEDLEVNYISLSEKKKQDKEKRSYQSW